MADNGDVKPESDQVCLFFNRRIFIKYLLFIKIQQKQVSLKVVNADGAELFFKIRRNTVLKKLMDAYCKKQGVNRSAVRFLFDGSPLDDAKTPDDLDMENEDVIDAMIEQVGGSF